MSPIKEKGSISTTLNLWWTGIDLNYRAFYRPVLQTVGFNRTHPPVHYLLLINTQQPITITIGIIIVKFHIPTKISNNNLIIKAVIPSPNIKYSIGYPYKNRAVP